VFKSSQGSQAVLIVAALLVIYVLLGVLHDADQQQDAIVAIRVRSWLNSRSIQQRADCSRRQAGRMVSG